MQDPDAARRRQSKRSCLSCLLLVGVVVSFCLWDLTDHRVSIAEACAPLATALESYRQNHGSYPLDLAAVSSQVPTQLPKADYAEYKVFAEDGTLLARRQLRSREGYQIPDAEVLAPAYFTIRVGRSFFGNNLRFVTYDSRKAGEQLEPGLPPGWQRGSQPG